MTRPAGAEGRVVRGGGASGWELSQNSSPAPQVLQIQSAPISASGAPHTWVKACTTARLPEASTSTTARVTRCPRTNPGRKVSARRTTGRRRVPVWSMSRHRE